MAYQDKYKEYLEQIPNYVGKCYAAGKRPVFGYTSNLDVVIKWDAAKFNQLLETHLVDEPDSHEGDIIGSMADFARIVSYYAINGLGGEIDITNIEVCKELEKAFTTEFALGGTCAQGAAALAAMGFPLWVHITDKSKEVCNLMNYNGLEVVSKGKMTPIIEVAAPEEPVRHMILQFTKGDLVKIRDREYTVPVSNRLIMDYDEIHKRLPLEEDFLVFCEEHAENIFSYNLSGFNTIIDRKILENKLEQLGNHYQRIKNKNKDCILYLEGAHYLSSESKDLVFRKLSKYIDILGMNEEELVSLGMRMNMKVDKGNLESVIHGLEAIIQSFGCKGIVMHTKDYSLYYGSELKDIDMEMGLTFGNLMSGTRAKLGKYGNPEECKGLLGDNLSKAGLAFAEELASMQTSRYACLVPSRYLEKPKYTIGLGDTFVAGMQICFIR